MEQFIYGLLAGVAIGMWGAILLYRYSGKAQPGWPFRSRTRTDNAASAGGDGPEDDGSPNDDYDEAYYAEQERARPQSAASAPPVDTGKSAYGTVVYTDARAQTSPAAAKTREELDAEFDAVASADWPDAWDEDEEEDEDTAAADESTDDPRLDDYARLILLLDGDAEAAEELIEAERKRTPAVARPRLIENALLRLQHDQA